MGVDISGGMYVGAWKSDFGIYDINFPEDWSEEDREQDWCEFLEENDIVMISPYYDADIDDCFFGIGVPDTVLDGDSIIEWLKGLNQKQNQFENIVGVPAALVGMQKVY